MDRAQTIRFKINVLKAELSGVESGVLPYVESVGSATSAQVAEHLGMSIPGANNHLHALYTSGLLRREREPVPGGGRGYRYIVP